MLNTESSKVHLKHLVVLENKDTIKDVWGLCHKDQEP